MSSFKEFMREKGFYFALLGCILAAALTSVWAIRTMVSRISIKDPSLLPQQQTEEPAPELAPEPATRPVEQKQQNVPIPGASSEALPQQHSVRGIFGQVFLFLHIGTVGHHNGHTEAKGEERLPQRRKNGAEGNFAPIGDQHIPQPLGSAGHGTCRQ